MRKLTLLIDDDIYDGLHRVAGRGNIGRFVSDKVKPYLVVPKDGDVASAFGCLAHLAKPVTDDQVEAAKRDFMRKRWAAKTAAQTKP
ncbi:MAG: hypothetical protein AB7P37_04390 [Ramlibacter sp.]